MIPILLQTQVFSASLQKPSWRQHGPCFKTCHPSEKVHHSLHSPPLQTWPPFNTSFQSSNHIVTWWAQERGEWEFNEFPLLYWLPHNKHDFTELLHKQHLISSSKSPCEVSKANNIIPILLDAETVVQRGKWLTQGHKACERQMQDLNLQSLTPSPMLYLTLATPTVGWSAT